MKTVFFDVDTQLDFVYPAGALYAPGAEQIVPALEKLTRFAAANHLPIIATADAHSENDPEFKLWKPHCVIGTQGQKKVSATLAPQQFLIEKQRLDCFSNPNLIPLLDSLAADRFVVYGVVTELCVQCAAFGLLAQGVKVALVADAIKSLDLIKEQAMIREFQARGGTLTTVAAVIG